VAVLLFPFFTAIPGGYMIAKKNKEYALWIPAIVVVDDYE